MDNAGPKRGNWQLQCYSPIARQLYWEKGHYGADEALSKTQCLALFKGAHVSRFK